MDIKDSILFEDTHLIVLNKPAGLLSQSDVSGEDSLVDILRVYLGRNYVGLVHRLDRNTSGIMVVAKRTKSAQRLTDSLQKGSLNRTYLALVEGKAPNSARFEHWLLKNEKTNEVKVVSADHSSKDKKIARLSFECVDRFEKNGEQLSLLHVQLETGRGHQIRVQLSSEGYPIVGDAKYLSKSKLLNRQALHSYHLKMPHPMSHDVVEYTAPLASDILSLIPKGLKLP